MLYDSRLMSVYRVFNADTAAAVEPPASSHSLSAADRTKNWFLMNWARRGKRDRANERSRVGRGGENVNTHTVCFLSSNKMLLFCVILRQDLVSFFIRTRGARQRGGGAYRAPSRGGGRGNRQRKCCLPVGKLD